MRKLIPNLLSLVLLLLFVSVASANEELGYSYGYQYADALMREGLPLDLEAVLAGVEARLRGEEPRISLQQMRRLIINARRESKARERAEKDQALQGRRDAGAAFLKENSDKPGVVTLPSGLQYRELRAGTGDRPGAEDRVRVHYRGTLIDGSEFDSSYKRGQPTSFKVGGVIAGWQEALQLMAEGAKWELFIPNGLAYGSRGKLAGETLLFEVELLSIER